MKKSTTQSILALLEEFEAGLRPPKSRFWPQRSLLASDALTKLKIYGLKLLFVLKMFKYTFLVAQISNTAREAIIKEKLCTEAARKFMPPCCATLSLNWPN